MFYFSSFICPAAGRSPSVSPYCICIFAHSDSDTVCNLLCLFAILLCGTWPSLLIVRLYPWVLHTNKHILRCMQYITYSHAFLWNRYEKAYIVPYQTLIFSAVVVLGFFLDLVSWAGGWRVSSVGRVAAATGRGAATTRVAAGTAAAAGAVVTSEQSRRAVDRRGVTRSAVGQAATWMNCNRQPAVNVTLHRHNNNNNHHHLLLLLLFLLPQPWLPSWRLVRRGSHDGGGRRRRRRMMMMAMTT